ncbi:hypothetical protein CDL12_02265 [Handroanthus impetiginosus]|uniref:Uncharacterized protein n=1 Tax=Handroanthus impetiginosus TaxID=429701 RepID=A0A2G9I5G4_9LAMI|nr:hypothetical protein CDL12_02265 [Handroanthus impetiginosus]
MRQWATDAATVNRCEKTFASAEKILKILNSSKPDLLQWRKDKAVQMMYNVVMSLREIRESNSVHLKKTQQVGASISHLEAPQTQQRENSLQFNNISASLHQSLRQGVALNPSSIVNSHQFSLMKSTPQHQWTPQGSVVSSPHKVSQICSDQRGLRMLLNPMDGSGQYDSLGTSQTTVTLPANIFNSSDYAVSPIAQPSVSVSPNKRQKMKQPVQQRTENNKQQMLQKRGEDMKLRRLVGFNQKGSPLPPPSSSSPYAASPQNSQQSSQQHEMKDLTSKLSKSATPSLSFSSSALPSPLTPLTPSSMPVDYTKSPSAAPAQLPSQETSQHQFVNEPCLHKESTYPPGDKQSPSDNGDAVKRLVEVVKSMSSKALNAALQDIDAVTNLTDREAVHRLPKKFVFQDLADDISRDDNGYFSNNNSMMSRMKRQHDAVTLNDSIRETEYHARDRIKRMEKEPNDHLLQEIEEINQKLIETVVDVSGRESDAGTLIRCSYIPVGISREIKKSSTSEQMFPNLLLDLVVASDYPNSSPTVLETMPRGCSDGEEGRCLWMKAKIKFTLSLRKYSQPIKLKEMAETWNACAREVFREFAEQMGGGDFSSKYGKWENCVVAA